MSVQVCTYDSTSAVVGGSTTLSKHQADDVKCKRYSQGDPSHTSSTISPRELSMKRSAPVSSPNNSVINTVHCVNTDGQPFMVTQTFNFNNPIANKTKNVMDAKHGDSFHNLYTPSVNDEFDNNSINFTKSKNPPPVPPKPSKKSRMYNNSESTGVAKSNPSYISDTLIIALTPTSPTIVDHNDDVSQLSPVVTLTNECEKSNVGGEVSNNPALVCSEPTSVENITSKDQHNNTSIIILGNQTNESTRRSKHINNEPNELFRESAISNDNSKETPSEVKNDKYFEEEEICNLVLEAVESYEKESNIYNNEQLISSCVGGYVEEANVSVSYSEPEAEHEQNNLENLTKTEEKENRALLPEIESHCSVTYVNLNSVGSDSITSSIPTTSLIEIHSLAITEQPNDSKVNSCENAYTGQENVVPRQNTADENGVVESLPCASLNTEMTPCQPKINAVNSEDEELFEDKSRTHVEVDHVQNEPEKLLLNELSHALTINVGQPNSVFSDDAQLSCDYDHNKTSPVCDSSIKSNHGENLSSTSVNSNDSYGNSSSNPLEHSKCKESDVSCCDKDKSITNLSDMSDKLYENSLPYIDEDEISVCTVENNDSRKSSLDTPCIKEPEDICVETSNTRSDDVMDTRVTDPLIRPKVSTSTELPTTQNPTVDISNPSESSDTFNDIERTSERLSSNSPAIKEKLLPNTNLALSHKHLSRTRSSGPVDLRLEQTTTSTDSISHSTDEKKRERTSLRKSFSSRSSVSSAVSVASDATLDTTLDRKQRSKKSPCYIEEHYGEVVNNLKGRRQESLFGSTSSIASKQSTWYIDLAVSSSAGAESESDDDEDNKSVVSSAPAASDTSFAPNKYGFIGGAQYTVDGEENIPVHVIRKRESKWLEMLNNWDSFMMKKYSKVRDRCRKGIPSAIRARAWQHLCGADKVLERNPGVYEQLVEAPIDPRTEEEIRKDLHRQFPLHEMFLQRGGHGQEDLYQVLKVHSLVCGDGYCQAHAPLAAVLLMQMPAEHAFWCLRAICDKYVPGYFSEELEAIQIDGDILFKLTKKISPSAYKLLKKQKIDPVLYMTEWFMCLFSRTLPWPCVLRVWDMFFCEGVKVLFRVGLVLLKYGLRPDVRTKCPSMYETLHALRNIPPAYMAEDFLLPQMIYLDISEDDLQKEHVRQVNRREKLQKAKQQR